MKNIINILIFLSIAGGIFALMNHFQSKEDLNMKTLEKLVEKEIKVIKDFKKKHIDSH